MLLLSLIGFPVIRGVLNQSYEGGMEDGNT